MEQETLFTASKWDILKCLEKGKKSPIDLSKEANTSIANVSQQLRLLELAGFIKSERVSNREKGQPRILYSLAGNYSYIVACTTNFVEKKFLKLDEYQKIILKIWFIEDNTLQYYIEKFYWSIEKNIDKIDFLGIDYSDSKNIKVHIISDNSEVKKGIKESSIDGVYGVKGFSISYIKEFDSKKHADKYVVLKNNAKIGG